MKDYNHLAPKRASLTSKVVVASSYTDFLTNYGSELREAVNYLALMQKAVLNNPDEPAFNEEGEMEEVLSNYDQSVSDSIIGWLFASRTEIDIDAIASLAANNYQRTGTEKQMVLYAIEDLYRWLDNKGLITEQN